MVKLETTRLILKDDSDDYWRLCRFSHAIDKFSEPFIKVMFPEFAKGSTLTKNVGLREKDGLLKYPKNSQGNPSKASAVSYHYIGGVVTLTEGQEHPSRYDWFPRIFRTRKPVLFCRCLLKDFRVCKQISDFNPEEDLLLDDFKTPCILGFYASYGNKPSAIERLDGRSHYIECSSDPKLLVTITEYQIESLNSNCIITNRDPYAWIRGTTWLGEKWHKLKQKLSELFE